MGRDPEPDPPTIPSRPKRLQSIAIGGMTSFAIVGFLAMLSLFTISLSGDTKRYVVIVVVFSAVGFLASASAAVLTAARDTYPNRSEGDGG